MESLPVDSRIRELYSAEIFSGGAACITHTLNSVYLHGVVGSYVTLPYGRTRYWLFGPEDGEKVLYYTSYEGAQMRRK